MKIVNRYYQIVLSGLLCLFLALPVMAQQELDIAGKVVSIVDNTPLAGINVRIDGVAGTAETTDDDGQFSISAASNATLIFSYPGYVEYTILLNGRKSLVVKLVPEGYASTLDMVPMASGLRQKRFLAQSYSVLNSSDFTERPYATPERFLTGKIAGVAVTAYNGAPGAGADLLLRGRASIHAGTQPLYIVDGMPVSEIAGYSASDGELNSSLFGINPEDIETVSFLKDGSALAMYGTRAANGVLLIETYKGQKGNSKIEFNASYGLSDLDREMKMLGADESRRYLSSMLYDMAGPAGMLNTYGGLVSYADAINNDPASLLYEKYNNDTDWMDEVTRMGAYSNVHFRMRGGDDVARYSFSVGYFDQTGIIENNKLSKLSARFNLDYLVSDKLRIGTNLSFSKNDGDMMFQLNSPYNPFLTALKKSPITTPYVQASGNRNTPILEDHDIFGLFNGSPKLMTFGGINNPAVLVSDKTRDVYSSTYINAKVFGEYIFTKEISLYGHVGLNNVTEQTMTFIPKNGVSPFRDMQRISQESYDENLLINAKLEGRYSKTFNFDHKLAAVLGSELIVDNTDTRFGRAYDSPGDDFTNLQGSRDTLATGSDTWKLFSMYANANYVYKEKYIAEATLRMDASSRFGTKERAQFFPGLALGWRIGQEDFLRDSEWIDELKLRASIGASGNDNIGNYTNQMLYTPANYKFLSGVALRQLANEYLKPERVTEIDLGVDWSIFNQRVNFSVDYYNRVTKDALVLSNMPSTSGMQYALLNAGEITNQGIEATMDLRFKTGAFNWNLGGNIAYNHNEVTDMPATTPYVESTYNGFAARAQQGKPVGSFYGFETNGIYRNNEEASALLNGGSEYFNYEYAQFQGGDVKFVDQNNDGIINDSDRVFLGDPNPDWLGAVNGSISVKGITLAALVDFQLGRDVVNGLRYELEGLDDFANPTVAVNRRWTVGNPNTDMPRLAYGDPAGNNRFSDRWVEDGSFVRLRTVTLSYDFPQELVKKFYFSSLRVYVSGENLLTSTKYLGYDPEFNHLGSTSLLMGVDGGSVPLTRTISVGVRFGL